MTLPLVDLVPYRGVAEAPSHGVPGRGHDAPLLVAKVVLLHRVEVAVLGRVAEDDDHAARLGSNYSVMS